MGSGSAVVGMTADPKPARRVVDKHAGKSKPRAEQRCRLCKSEFWNGLGLSRHHLIPRSQGGDDIARNIVPLCGDGTRGCHGLVEAFPEARMRLRGELTQDEIDYCVAKVGQDRFDRRYPTKIRARPRRSTE